MFMFMFTQYWCRNVQYFFYVYGSGYLRYLLKNETNPEQLQKYELIGISKTLF